MTQQIIDVDGVPTLFSPVMAHALEPGDLFTLPVVDDRKHFTPIGTRRVLSPPVPADGDRVTFTRSDPTHGTRVVTYSANRPVLRAVGARAGRGGAR